MGDTSTKIGHGLAKGLGIKLEPFPGANTAAGRGEPITRGESVFSVSSADTYIEEEPHTMDWINELIPSPKQVGQYFYNIFPFLKWIMRYNVQWLIGDLIAGITVGAVVVPQSMAYADLANLDAQFGLYSAFMGVLIYWFFATSKDITIGPVAVMSTLVGNILDDAAAADSPIKDIPGYKIAGCLAVIAGSIITFMGFARLGFIVEFISATAVAAFITGAAISIATGQLINLIGISSDDVDTHQATYLVFIDTLKNLPVATGLTAAIGITALFALYLWRYICNMLAKKYPSKAKIFFIISTLRTAVVILFYTMVSWLSQKDVATSDSDNSAWKILGTVPRGFQDAQVPWVRSDIISFFLPYLPATVIVLLIEHIAIAKSFGRINNYTINPSQELLAIGITNLLGPFLGAYPATGSFSRTAIKSKAGVRTPIAGVITAIVVLLAIYALPAVFYWIPSACLAAVIIHAVGDLIMPPNTVYTFWRVNPWEVFIFFLGVIVTVFVSIEVGIYCTVAVSAAILLFRVAKARGRFLGRIKVHSVVGDNSLDNNTDEKQDLKFSEKRVSTKEDESTGRTVFIPYNHRDGSNPKVSPDAPYPGVFVYRFSEGLNYPNVNHYLDDLTEGIFANTRRTNPHVYGRPGDRPWNDPGPKKGVQEYVDYSKPTLKAVILDFSSVNNVDVTVVQNLIDVRNQLDRYTAPEKVEWHFTNINNRWTKRALISGGFGFPTPEDESGAFHRFKPLFSVAEFGGSSSAATAAEQRDNRDVEAGGEIRPVSAGRRGSDNAAVVHGMNRPFFHVDVYAAVQSAIASEQRNAEFRKEIKPAESDGSS